MIEKSGFHDGLAVHANRAAKKRNRMNICNNRMENLQNNDPRSRTRASTRAGGQQAGG